MIKTIDQIKLKHLASMERSGKVNQFLSWWNFLPVFLFKKTLVSFIAEIYKLISDGKSYDDSFYELEVLEHKVGSALKIQGLEACYLILIKDLELLPMFDHLIRKFRLTRAQRRKLKDVDFTLLGKAIDKIKVYTGINVTTDNIQDIQKELIYLKDKFSENFNKKTKEPEENNKKIGIIEYAGSFALYAGSSFIGIGEMTIPEFVALKNNATKKYEAEKKHIENIENGKRI